MHAASVFANAIQNNETLHSARERLATMTHVGTHYRAIAMPALAAAAQSIAKARQNRQRSSMSKRPVVAGES